MESTRRRIFTIFSLVFLLLGVTGVNLTGAATKAKLTAPGVPTNVKAVGGLNRATVSWKAPASNGGVGILWYRVIYYPGAVGYNCKGSVLSCIITIKNPNKPSPKPKPISYYFTVTAINSIGSSPASARSSTVSVNFTGTIYIPPAYGPATPTPTPTPSSTPTPAPTAYLTTAFDGSYAGQADVTIGSPGSSLGSTSKIATTFTVLNGRGTGRADNWAIDGYVTDPAGAAYVTVGDPKYGSLSFTVDFTQDPVTKVMSGNGRGTATFHLSGFGDIAVTFVFSVSKGEHQ